MAIPERHEEHVLSCALCGHSEIQSSPRELELAIERHTRRVHARRSAYDPRAFKTVTILFEGVDPSDDEQPMEWTDPMYQFTKYAQWSMERDD